MSDRETPGPTQPAGPTIPDTLEDTPVAGDIELVGVDALGDPSNLQHHVRYRGRTLLGAGGMGEVYASLDTVIGREVAIKVLKTDCGRPDDRARFVAEARVQGQLEHPAVVPVHDLGESPGGAAFFTMKRIRGTTLREILHQLADDAPGAHARYSRRKLLAAYLQVCKALDFAHANGVVHRDLKPENLMFGDFGEVYLLDWGLAKVGAEAEASDVAVRHTPATGVGASTQDGAMAGTPGYMAPEQARGQAVTAAADIYALGAILFELLTFQPLHLGPPASRLGSTLDGTDARPSVRAPDTDVPPELEAICLRATALHPDQRFRNAGELADAVERYLDGDRDLRRRHELAHEHTERARAATARIGTEGEAGKAARIEALRELGRALALEPTNPDAIETMTELLTNPPAESIPEVETRIEATVALQRRLVAAGAAAALAVIGIFLIGASLAGLRSLPLFVISCSLVGAAFVTATWIALRRHTGTGPGLLLFGLSASACATFSSVVGPFILVPSIILIMTLSFILAANEPRWGWFGVAVGILVIVVPWLLDLLGVTPAAYSFEGGKLLVHSRALDLGETSTTALLLAASVITVGLPAVVVVQLRNTLDKYQRLRLLQIWQLHQLVPGDAIEATRGRARAGGKQESPRPAQ